MKILLLGKNGQVGWELQRSLAALGDVVALDRSTTSDGLCGDLGHIDSLIKTIRTVAPAIIVNAAAYTAVDKAESEAELAHAINAHAVGILAHEAKQLDACLVHYSTDYVFSGQGTIPWQEQDTVAPQSSYGRSKLAGEAAIIASGAYALIFRTSWVFGVHGHNFLKTMLQAATRHETLKVVADQWGAPTSAHCIADITAHALQQIKTSHLERKSHLFHLAPSGYTHWHAYASYAIEYARACGWPVKTQQILALATAEWPTPAVRPANSRLDCRKLETLFKLHMPDWESGVRRVTELLIQEGLQP